MTMNKDSGHHTKKMEQKFHLEMRRMYSHYQKRPVSATGQTALTYNNEIIPSKAKWASCFFFLAFQFAVTAVVANQAAHHQESFCLFLRLKLT